jgi:hypothetical protein
MIIRVEYDEVFAIRNNGRLLQASNPVVELNNDTYLERFVLHEPFSNQFYCYWVVYDIANGRPIHEGAVRSIFLNAIKEYYSILPYRYFFKN